MTIYILKSFISRLGFVSKKINTYYSNYDINITLPSEKQNNIIGTININPTTSESEIILFESKFDKTDDMLIFKTKYQSEGKIYEDVDCFTITPEYHQRYSSSKTKFLIHISNGNLFQSYRVGKKYKFENGINESLSKLNMDNKEVINMLNQSYGNAKKR